MAADGLGANDVRAVCQTPQGGLLVADARGLSAWRGGHWSSYSCGPLAGVAADSLGRAWFSHTGAERLIETLSSNGIEHRPALPGLPWQDPNTLLFGRDGTLWVADELGLTWLKPERLSVDQDLRFVPDRAKNEPAFGRFAIGHDLPKMFPLGLVEDLDGSIWMGSLANGLFHVRGGRVESFGRKDGLPSDSTFTPLANGLELANGGQIFGPAHRHLGNDQRVNTENSNFPKREWHAYGSRADLLVISQPRDRSEAIQRTIVRIQVKIANVGQFPRVHGQRKPLWRKTMDGVKVNNGRLDAEKILRPQPATDINVLRQQGRGQPRQSLPRRRTQPRPG